MIRNDEIIVVVAGKTTFIKHIESAFAADDRIINSDGRLKLIVAIKRTGCISKISLGVTLNIVVLDDDVDFVIR